MFRKILFNLGKSEDILITILYPSTSNECLKTLINWKFLPVSMV